MSVFKINSKNNIDYARQNIDINRILCIRVGDYRYSAESQDVNNWLLCDGRSLLRSQYQELFAIIGVNFGSNDGNSFSLPDYRGRVPGIIGSGSGLTSRNLGDNLGEENHTLTIPEMPTHTHNGTTDNAGAHTHTIDDIPYGVQNIAAASGGGTTACDETVHTVSTNSANDHAHTFTTNNTGGGNQHNNMQPTLFGSNVFIFSKLDKYERLSSLELKIILEY